MISNFFKAVGTVFTIIVFLLVTLVSLYISYVLAIGLLIAGSIYVAYNIYSTVDSSKVQV